MSEQMLIYLVARAQVDYSSGDATVREAAGDFLAAYDLFKMGSADIDAVNNSVSASDVGATPDYFLFDDSN